MLAARARRQRAAAVAEPARQLLAVEGVEVDRREALGSHATSSPAQYTARPASADARRAPGGEPAARRAASASRQIPRRRPRFPYRNPARPPIPSQQSEGRASASGPRRGDAMALRPLCFGLRFPRQGADAAGEDQPARSETLCRRGRAPRPGDPPARSRVARDGGAGLRPRLAESAPLASAAHAEGEPRRRSRARASSGPPRARPAPTTRAPRTRRVRRA